MHHSHPTQKAVRSMLVSISVVIVTLATTGCYFQLAPSTSSFPVPHHVDARQGIILQEGENISGVYNWNENLPTSVAYSYSFYPPNERSPGLLEMEFELLNGEVYDALIVQLIVIDEQGRTLSAGRIFERKQREDLAGTHRELRMDPYAAYSFDIIGSGFFNRNHRSESGGSFWPFELP